jgi:hypothetical protein
MLSPRQRATARVMGIQQSAFIPSPKRHSAISVCTHFRGTDSARLMRRRPGLADFSGEYL